MASSVRDNGAALRFEMDVDAKIAFITYRRAGNVVTLLHAEVPHELAGHGVGAALVKGTLELLSAQGQKVVPRCSFVVTYFKRHPEYAALLADA